MVPAPVATSMRSFVTFVTVPALVLLTAAAASWIPALRASRAAPSEVLRSD